MLPSQALHQFFVGHEVFNKNDNAVVDPDSIKVSYHAFNIGNISILLPQHSINEVIEKLSSCQLPNTNELLYGMANLRGNIIPIFDLHENFGFVSIKKHNRKILVIGKGVDAAAVLIDELPISISISEQDRCSPVSAMPEALQPFVTGSYQVTDTIWLKVDLSNFFTNLSEFI